MLGCSGPWIKDSFRVNHGFLPALVLPISCGSVWHVQAFILSTNQHSRTYIWSWKLRCKY